MNALDTSARAMSSTPPVPTDPVGEFVGDVHVVIDGDRARPAVALVHGIPGSVRDWRYLAPALVDAGLCAVRFDMPGFGQTPIRAFGSPKTANRAAFVRQTMRALGIPRFAIAGHSVGGAVALLCAAAFPDDVTVAAFINSVGTCRHRGLALPTSMLSGLARATRTPLLGAWAVGSLRKFYEGRGDKLRGELDADAAAFHLEIVASLDFLEQRAAARAVRCPALVIASKNDPLIEPFVGARLARALVRSPLVSQVVVDEGGHTLHKHEARRIARWLADRLS